MICLLENKKKNEEGVELVSKLIDIWKSDPINNHKKLLKRIENLIIELNGAETQKLLNTYFTPSGKSLNSFEITLNDSKQDLQSGKEKIKIDNVKDEIISDDEIVGDEDDNDISISLTKDILPFVIPLSCILTLNDSQMDFSKMLNNIKNNKELLDVFNEQSTVWWE